jgi:hypothetical protein
VQQPHSPFPWIRTTIDLSIPIICPQSSTLTLNSKISTLLASTSFQQAWTSLQFNDLAIFKHIDDLRFASSEAMRYNNYSHLPVQILNRVVAKSAVETDVSVATVLSDLERTVRVTLSPARIGFLFA